MYSVWIVDDDARAAQAACVALEYCPQAAELQVRCADVDALEVVVADSSHAPQVVLMDIELGCGRENGMELVKRLFPAGSSTQVIYITGHIEYCQDVYRTQHVSFIVKPLRQDLLDDAIATALRNIENERGRVLLLKTRTGTCCVPYADIEFIESLNRKIVVHTADEVFESNTANSPNSSAGCRKPSRAATRASS